MECFPEVKCMVNNGLPGKASRKRPSNVFLRLKNPPKLVQNGVLAVQWSAHVPFSAVIRLKFHLGRMCMRRVFPV